MRRSGHADLPLHYGRVPQWLAVRMASLGGAIVESIILNYGREEFLKRMSDPFWFQSLGAVLGMDWHSSGITTSVMGALKKSVNQRSSELGVFICGGRGKHSRATPAELLQVGEKTGLDAEKLVRASRLSAKVDNTAIQDGFQLYLHSFVVSQEGEWAVVQQGMNPGQRTARRYHWHSQQMTSFIEEPHSFIYGPEQGLILNLTDKKAASTKAGILELVTEPGRFLTEYKKLVMPSHHDVKEKDVDVKKLGALLALAADEGNRDFESLLLTKGLGPRAIQSLTLVSEVVHGTPSRFKDPARFSFAHGGKDGHPFPVPTTVYDETIRQFEEAVKQARLGHKDRDEALKQLYKISERLEKDFRQTAPLQKLIEEERRMAPLRGGRVAGDEKVRKKDNKNNGQLKLF